MRRVINDLHPATLEQFGLASAIEHLTSDFGRASGIKISFHDTVAPMELSKFQQLCIFRIVQEALNNVEKHAGASEVEVALENQDGFIVVRVADNGNGSISQKPGSYGLQNIAHRAGLIGALVDWMPPAKYSSGTMLVLRLPIPEQSEPLQQPQQLQQRDA
jgi:two-component system, NarL family, sensor kinase